MYKTLDTYLNQQTSSSILSVFRCFFGFLMLFSIIRFWLKGWIEELYLDPVFHFSYYGFEWVSPIGEYTYLIFFICGLSAFFVAIGFKYRVSIVIFFLSFLYIELMDKTTYLNHYYFINLVSFLLIFLPANASFSIDNLISKKSYQRIPQWSVDSIKLLVAIVYIYAGIAKINSDWLLSAMPLGIWLSSKYDYVIFGDLFQKEWIHYFMSWGGMLYDITIPFLLLYSRTRIFAFVMVILFHLMTKFLFPIGMFPYIMIIASMVFFSPKFHDKIIGFFHHIKEFFSIQKSKIEVVGDSYYCQYRKIILSIFCLFFLIQLIIPFRYVLYPGELLWHEQGYRFSWRVMLVEKTGIANFKIVNPDDDSFFYVDNTNFLTPLQEKQMSFQPDFILEYAHYLGDYYSYGNQNIKVFVDNYVALNGRKSQMLVSDTVNLYTKKESFKHKDWIIALNDDIQGF
jgi:hypothetical protein